MPHEEGQYYSGRQEISNQDFLGLVLSYDKTISTALIEQRNKFSVGDIVEIFGPNTKVQEFKINSIINEDNVKCDSASHAQEKVKIYIPFEVHENDIMRVKIS